MKIKQAVLGVALFILVALMLRQKPARTPPCASPPTGCGPPVSQCSPGPSPTLLPKLRVSPNGHFLVKDNGVGGTVPFFLMQDTAWALPKLQNNEIDDYLRDRKNKSFNAILIALKFYDGTLKNDLPDGEQIKFHDASGDHLAWKNNDTAIPDCAFWGHIDDIVTKAAASGIYVSITLAWSYNYPQLGIDRTCQGLCKAYNLGHWVGDRYKNNSNIIWVVSGEYDYYCQRASPACDDSKAPWKPIYEQIARGLKDGDKGTHLLTIHPGGYPDGSSSVDYQGSRWLDFNFLQSGHYIDNHAHVVNKRNFREGYDLVRRDWTLASPIAKPVIDGECAYETLPDGFFSKPNPSAIPIAAADVRRKAYWEVFSGAAGHTYGDANVEMFQRGADNYYGATKSWQDGLGDAGSAQMRYLRALIEAYSSLTRVPDQSIISKVGGTTGTGGASVHHCVATRASDGSWALVYTPQGDSLTIDMMKVNATTTVKASWYNPRDGSWKAVAGAGIYSSTATQIFIPPSNGLGNDWVLALESIAASSPKREGTSGSLDTQASTPVSQQ